jgi:prevent-host-death family protein
MREITVREANQNFSQVIAAAERGETIVVTKNGRPVAKITPQPQDREPSIDAAGLTTSGLWEAILSARSPASSE